MSESSLPSTGWKEIEKPGEQERFEAFARKIEGRQRKDAPQGGGPLRGFHAKTHAGLNATFTVLDNLPPHARFGVFSEPRIFPAVVRFSNGKPTREADRGREPRGIAIKLAGVAGPKLLTPPGEEHATTQDFLATSHSVTSTVRDAEQFIAFIEASESRFLPFSLARKIGALEAARILGSLAITVGLSNVRSMVTEHFSSTAPIKLGPHAVKFTVRPAEGTAPPAPRELTDDFLREELADRLRKGDIVLDFVVQFFVDEARTPIEDTSVAWKPAHAPFLKVAELRIPRCDLDDPASAAVSSAVDRLSFTPWHAIEEHRPLGSIMRARKFAYRASSSLRGHSPEPTALPL